MFSDGLFLGEEEDDDDEKKEPINGIEENERVRKDGSLGARTDEIVVVLLAGRIKSEAGGGGL